MEEMIIVLGAVTSTIVIAAAAVGYTKFLKKRMKKYVLRYDKIKKYFEEGRE